MPLFTSTYINKVDKKGRISVPAPFRSTLSIGNQSIAVFPSLVSKAIEGFDCSYLEHISERLNNYDMLISPVKKQEPAAKILSRSITIAIDSDGRIVLPQDFIQHAGITDRAIFVGFGQTFQIWGPEEYDLALAQNEEA